MGVYIHYIYNNDNRMFEMRDGEELLDEMPEVWMIADMEDGTLLKHGSKHRLETIWRDMQDKLRNSKNPNVDVAACRNLANDVVLIRISDGVTGLSVEEINKCLDINGYLHKYLKQIQHVTDNQR